MLKNSDRISFERLKRVEWRDPRIAMRVVLGILTAANVAALILVLAPPGGSAQDLDAQLITLRARFGEKRAALERTKAHAAKVNLASRAGGKFEADYFTDRRVASSTFVAELSKSAAEAGIRAKEHTFLFEPVEGSDSFSMMTITGGYEGTYADLVQFVSRLDRSQRFLILDSLTAAPMQSGGLLSITIKLNAFVREVRA
jgi:type IV pilus assembly protein PilO